MSFSSRLNYFKILGVFENHSRDELKKMVESKGGKVILA